MKKHLAVLGLLLSVSSAACNTAPPEDKLTYEESPTPSVQAPSASPTETDDPRAQIVRDHLDGNFSGTTWYPHIKRVYISSNVVWVETDLVADGDAREPASGICRGVSSYVFSNENTVGLTGITVRAISGERLVLRTSVSDPC